MKLSLLSLLILLAHASFFCLQAQNLTPSGTGSTIYSFNSNWVTDAFLYNNGKRVGIGTQLPKGLLSIETDGSQQALWITGRSGVVTSNTMVYMTLSSQKNAPAYTPDRLSFFVSDNGGASSREAFTIHKNGHISVNWAYQTRTQSPNVSDDYLPRNELEVWGNQAIFGDLIMRSPDFNTDHKPELKITSGGKIIAREIEIHNDAIPPDYVFEPDYRLLPLEEVQEYINREMHLPGVPSAAEMLDKGVDVGDMQYKLLEKIEELTLYIIDQEKRISELEKQLKQKTNE